MTALHPLAALIRKDLLQEWRQKHVFFGVLLYVGSTVFVVFIMSGQPDARMWNALFWIIQVFVAANAVAKSFLQEPPSRFRYYYTLVSPAVFFTAKLVYSAILMAFLTGCTLLLHYLLLGTAIENAGLFIATALLGGLSLSVVFTFLSALAAKAGQSAALMAVMGFPLVIPLLLLLSKLSLAALLPTMQAGVGSLVLMLLCLDVLVVALGLILFPFLWQE